MLVGFVSAEPRWELQTFYLLKKFFFLFMDAPVAYGISLARGQMGAAAASLHHSTATPDPSCNRNLHHSLWQCQILNSLSEARNQTHNLTETTVMS